MKRPLLARPPLDQLSRPQLNSSNFTLLLELFPPRLEHLIVRSFFDTIGDEMFAERFFLFIHAGTRHAMAFGRRSDVPVISQFRALFSFLRRSAMFCAQKLL